MDHFFFAEKKGPQRSIVIMHQRVKPFMAPPPPFNRLLRGHLAHQFETMMHELLAVSLVSGRVALVMCGARKEFESFGCDRLYGSRGSISGCYRPVWTGRARRCCRQSQLLAKCAMSLLTHNLCG